MNMKTENIYKKIIISILATLALTACGGGGGGGGGGGSSAPPPTPLPEPPEIQKPNIDITKPDSNTGVLAYKNGDIFHGKYENKDIISMSGNSVIGAKGENVKVPYGKTIEIVDTKGAEAILGSGIDKITDLTGYSYGIYSKNGEIKNLGDIVLGGDSAVGIYGENSSVINSGTISGNGNNLVGILGINSKEFKTVINNGEISLKGNNVIGMKLHRASGVNNDVINIDSPNGIGISVVGKNSIAINNGDINIAGNGIGIYAGYQASGRNNSTGNINILGNGYGMYANNHGYVLNEGTITLSANAKGAMVADGTGSVAENRGNIVIDSSNQAIKNNELQAINGGQVINSGTITYTDNATISAVGGTYMISGTDEENYGKVKADSININGNIVVDGDIVKGSYKENYTFEKVFDADQIEFDENYKLVSNSLLYDSKLEKDEDGDYNSKLIRNDKNISDFANSNYLSSAKMLDRYFSEENYNSLNSDGKKLIDLLNISNINGLNENLRDLTPSLYANNIEIAKDISRKFESTKVDIIETLGEKDYNFALIGDYNKLDSKDSIVGYKMKTTGVLGSFAIKDGYVSLGYGYSDVDFKDDSNGETNSLYLAYDRYKKYDDFNLKYGVNGNYYFNEITREMKSFKSSGDSKFDSYIVKAYGEISKRYSSFLDVEPYFGVDFGYYKSEDFEENSVVKIDIDNQDVLFVEPKVGTKIYKKFENLSLYGELEYSYEFRDDKDLDYQYSGIVEKGRIDLDEDRGTSFKIGAEYEKDGILLGLEAGKTIGNRDNDFVSAKIGYRF